MNEKQPLITEMLWDRLLSRHPEQILSAYQVLSKKEQSAIRHHLKRMIIEEGWHEDQRYSAKVALSTISNSKGD